MLTSHIIRTAVEAALAEDAPYGDITCETTIPADETGSAHLTARENGVMSASSAARYSPPWKARYATCSPPSASPSTSPSA